MSKKSQQQQHSLTSAKESTELQVEGEDGVGAEDEADGAPDVKLAFAGALRPVVFLDGGLGGLSGHLEH